MSAASPLDRESVPQWWPPETIACYSDLASYRLVGASACADQITNALQALALRAEADDRNLSTVLTDAGKAFCALKPDTALYINAVAYLTGPDKRMTARVVQARAEALSDYRSKAQTHIIRATADLLDDAGAVLVHDYSSAVARVLGELGRRGARDVIVTAGEPLGQGPRVARLAVEAGHRVTYVPDATVGRHSGGISSFVTGVETFYGDGSMANTVGTLPLALVSRESGANVIAPAEALKFHPHQDRARVEHLSARLLHRWPPDAANLHPSCRIDDHVLDAVPGALITTYVTEVGSCPPTAVGSVAAAVLELFSP